ncbi:hypothetical protein AYI68_g1579 [Smittium mucronatum]|uniref:Uncharacterized protein n=1 Tax=Smittium mucronatum TaxID=133383 RepID=A0A1R0H594_9FUNG|nr:hypothetical protein AYI68_g1579 [Smittium mucronatum]
MKRPDPYEFNYLVILFSEAWLLGLRNDIFRSEQIIEMDSEITVSLPRIAIINGIFNEISETLDTYQYQSPPKNSLKKGVFQIPGLRRKNSTISEANNNLKSTDFLLLDGPNNNEAKSLIINTILGLYPEVMNPKCAMEDMWWFKDNIYAIRDIKRLFFECSIEYFVDYFLFSQNSKLNVNDLFHEFRISLDKFLIEICKKFVSGDFELSAGKDKNNTALEFDKSDDIDNNDTLTSQLSKNLKDLDLNLSKNYDEPINFNNPLLTSDIRIRRFNNTDCQSLFEKTSAPDISDTETKYFKDSNSFKTKGLNIYESNYESTNADKIHDFYIKLCQISDILQTEKFAKPFRSVFHNVYKMNTDE